MLVKYNTNAAKTLVFGHFYSNNCQVNPASRLSLFWFSLLELQNETAFGHLRCLLCKITFATQGYTHPKVYSGKNTFFLNKTMKTSMWCSRVWKKFRAWYVCSQCTRIFLYAAVQRNLALSDNFSKIKLGRPLWQCYSMRTRATDSSDTSNDWHFLGLQNEVQ